MLFGSISFVFVFLPLMLAGYHWCRVNGWQICAKGLLIVGSLVFYGWWNIGYVPLVLLSVFGNYTVGRAMVRYRTAAWWIFLLGISLNLGLLIYFKYANFLLGNVAFAFHHEFAFARIAIPLAISFFTFQQIAYLTEIHRGQPAAASLTDYALFVLFFPHLIAGPITLHTEMLPQFARSGRGPLDSRWVMMGFAIFVLGLAKKVLVADTLGDVADPVFSLAAAGAAPSLPEAWLGALGYTFQLYFDFSGYSDMAIGIGLLFGIRFPVNFTSPYKATSISEFWRRWHMTLSRFLRNYVYVPLGGNRRGRVRRYANLLATMLLGGLWHGAGWTFVIWGALHGAYLCLNHLASALGFGAGRLGGRTGLLLGWALTFVAVVVGWVFFRAPSVAAALQILGGMVPGVSGAGAPGLGLQAFGWVAVAVAAAVALLMPSILEFTGYHALLETGQIRGARWEAVWTRPVFAAASLGVIAALCATRLPDPGLFLYFTF
jgi:alginate O-acetyltransferase complex protein AlgI